MTTEKFQFVFIHGAGGTRSKWRLLAGHLDSDVSGDYVDLPGHGSNLGAVVHTVEEYATVIDSHVKSDVIVVGHSMGGLVGMELAAQNPHVRALALVASHYVLPVHPKILTELKAGVFPESLFYASYSKEINQELLAEEKTELEKVSKETTFLDYDACNSYVRGEETFRHLQIPVFSLYGEEDRLLPRNAREQLKVANSRVSTDVITGAGHYLMLERPQEVANALQSWARSL